MSAGKISRQAARSEALSASIDLLLRHGFGLGEGERENALMQLGLCLFSGTISEGNSNCLSTLPVWNSEYWTFFSLAATQQPPENARDSSRFRVFVVDFGLRRRSGRVSAA